MLPTATETPTPLPPSPTPTVTFTPTPVLLRQGPGTVKCPILLYHRIAVPAIPNEYYVSPDNFRAQMQALKDWGYTPITTSLLVRAIKEGVPLPLRPVIISFDDGDISVYTDAFPVMREFGFVGVIYLVANRLNVDGYMRPEQIQALAQAGWEVGSHSMTHANLTASDTLTAMEIIDSRALLEASLGLPVATFAYPFGAQNEAIMGMVSRYYSAAVGLGSTVNQSNTNLYYLWRRPVKYEWDVATFGSFLPWNSPP
jgi:peptidoglycan/xylan/chitin deacetylase (PgdA/CDA1 family)